MSTEVGGGEKTGEGYTRDFRKLGAEPDTAVHAHHPSPGRLRQGEWPTGGHPGYIVSPCCKKKKKKRQNKNQPRSVAALMPSTLLTTVPILSQRVSRCPTCALLDEVLVIRSLIAGDNGRAVVSESHPLGWRKKRNIGERRRRAARSRSLRASLAPRRCSPDHGRAVVPH